MGALVWGLEYTSAEKVEVWKMLTKPLALLLTVVMLISLVLVPGCAPEEPVAPPEKEEPLTPEPGPGDKKPEPPDPVPGNEEPVDPKEPEIPLITPWQEAMDTTEMRTLQRIASALTASTSPIISLLRSMCCA